MPSDHDTLLRQWQMLRMIPRHPAKIAASQLCERLCGDGFDVSKRTVERDLQSLSQGYPNMLDERETLLAGAGRKIRRLLTYQG
jgi:predicted DNA-binding transcriptional regulator YafY